MANSTGSETAVARPPDVSRSWLQRFGLRWLVLYLLLYNVHWLARLLPGLDFMGRLWDALWQPMVVWVGTRLLGLPYVEVETNGSGDKTADWVLVGCLIVLSLVGALVWSWFDRTSQHDRLIYEIMRVGVRYALAASMLTYGFAKVFHLQMPFPGFYRLTEPYGNSSPMGLLWTFMGYSAGYSFFAGITEVLGGALVLFRRTTTLGALVIAAVMLNIEILNLCFDVPVKLYAAHLLFMAIILLAPDVRRLADIFVLNRPAPAVDLSRDWSKRWMGPATLAVKMLVIVWLLYSTIAPDLKLVAEGKLQPEVDSTQFVLLSREFHWISDAPYNR
jgi:uncharacterized membrane protein YphA (DoxX/SURF4 family)